MSSRLITAGSFHFLSAAENFPQIIEMLHGSLYNKGIKTTEKR